MNGDFANMANLRGGLAADAYDARPATADFRRLGDVRLINVCHRTLLLRIEKGRLL
jgi:hypothetical protein